MRRPSRGFAWPLAASLLCHGLALSVIDWPHAPPNTPPRRLEAGFERRPSAAPATAAPPEDFRETSHSSRQPGRGPKFPKGNLGPLAEKAPAPPRLPANEATAPGLSASETAAPGGPAGQAAPARIDVAQALSQAREYARMAGRFSPEPFTYAGDYLGSYTGADEGTFLVRLDASGHASGTAQSRRFGLAILISGTASTSGEIRMSGSGTAGKARFSGQLNARTGEVAGSWSAPGIGGGSFTGRRE